MAQRLYRSRKDRKIAGVCGGIAEYFDIDSTIVRIIALVLILAGIAPAVLAYLLLWVILPENPAQ